MFNPDEVEEPFGVGKLEINGVEHDVPYVTVQYGETPITLHWGNTVLRLFHYETEMNHVEYREPGEALKGIRMSEQMLALMEQYGYPLQKDPTSDDETKDWFVQMEMSDLEAELEALGEE